MADDSKFIPPKERRSAERVPDDADWETKVMARVRGNLRRAASDVADSANANVEKPVSTDHDVNPPGVSPILSWEEEVAARIRNRKNTDQS